MPELCNLKFVTGSLVCSCFNCVFDQRYYRRISSFTHLSSSPQKRNTNNKCWKFPGIKWASTQAIESHKLHFEHQFQFIECKSMAQHRRCQVQLLWDIVATLCVIKSMTQTDEIYQSRYFAIISLQNVRCATCFNLIGRYEQALRYHIFHLS